MFGVKMESELNNESIIKKTKVKSPSYLITLLDVVEDIVLIHKMSELEDSICTTSSRNISTTSSCLDVTGSPLKVSLNNSSLLNTSHFDISENAWTEVEEQYWPIPIQQARKLIADHCKQSNDRKSESVWCLCNDNGNDNEQHIVLLSIAQTPTSITRCQVIVEGYLPRITLSFSVFRQQHFDLLKRIMRLNATQIQIMQRQLVCNVSSIYDVLNCKKGTNNSHNKKVTVEIKWNQCTEEIPIRESKTTMTVETIIGDEYSLAFEIWKKLLQLELYVKVLSEYSTKDTQNDDWLPCSGRVMEEQHLINNVLETIVQCERRTFNYHHNKKHRNSVSDDTNIGVDLQMIVKNIANRSTSSNITDQLWTLLSQCTTCGILTNCMSVVFTEIANNDGKSNAYVTDSNGTCMAQIIKGIITGKLPVPTLTNIQAIQLLIDIGLEKLRNEFMHIFTHGNISTMYDLNELFKDFVWIDGTKELSAMLYRKMPLIRMENIEQRMKILGQLYTVLEILLLIPSDWVPYAKKTVYEYYVGASSPIHSFAGFVHNKSHQIQVDLPTSKIHYTIERSNPLLWRLSMLTNGQHYNIQSVHHLSQRPIFPPSVYNSGILQETLSANDIFYHHTSLSRITNFIKTHVK